MHIRICCRKVAFRLIAPDGKSRRTRAAMPRLVPRGRTPFLVRIVEIISDGLHSQTDEHQAREVALAAGAPNRMLELGRPESVRIV